MIILKRSLASAAALVALLGTSALAPAFAADATAPQAPMAVTSNPVPHKHMKKPMAPPSPEEMKRHVEERIETLHAKLMITPEQESDWKNVAQAMRDSEAKVADLVESRHKNAGTMNAVDDLESYQAIAQAHADGLKSVNDSFKELYEKMSDDQKKNADKVFSSYEGHGPEMEHKHHHHMHKDSK